MEFSPQRIPLRKWVTSVLLIWFLAVLLYPPELGSVGFFTVGSLSILLVTSLLVFIIYIHYFASAITVSTKTLVSKSLFSKKIIDLTNTKSIKLIGIYPVGFYLDSDSLVKKGLMTHFDIRFTNIDGSESWLKGINGWTFQDISNVIEYIIKNFPSIKSLDYDIKQMFTRHVANIKKYDFSNHAWSDNIQLLKK